MFFTCNLIVDFNAHDFVQELLSEGATIACDETSEAFNGNGNLPPFYDEELFKR